MRNKKTAQGIPGRLKEVRKTLCKTNMQTSEEAGLAAGTISGFENGTHNPNFNYLFFLAKKYNVNINWLLTGDGPMFNRGFAFEIDLGPFNYIMEEVLYLLNHSDQVRFLVLQQMLELKDRFPQVKEILAARETQGEP